MQRRLQVGAEIRRQRESQGLSLHKLGIMVGTSGPHIWRIENGKVSVGIDRLGDISEALDVPLRDLVDPPHDSIEYSSGRNPSRKAGQR